MYQPKPMDTSSAELPEGISALVEKLAAHNHGIWARQRIAEGWVYGPKRNDDNRTHPDLVPYDQLPESEKAYDRNTAVETLKVIIVLGYRIEHD